MQTIQLILKQHNGEERIFAVFAYSKEINTAIKQVKGIKWSQTNKQWHLPPEKNSVEALKEKINSFAVLDTSLFKKTTTGKK